MSSSAKPRYTLEEYLGLERRADHKSEFLGGEIFGMAGASFRRNIIVANIIGELGTLLRGGPCQAVSSDQRVQIQATGLNTYPDVVVVCGEPLFTDDHLDTLLNPSVLVEVLSESTEAYDRGEKFAHYRRLESLTDYLLVSQDKRRVEHYVRQGNQWVLSEFSAPDAVVPLSSLGCELSLAGVYERVTFAPARRPPPVEAPRPNNGEPEKIAPQPPILGEPEPTSLLRGVLPQREDEE